MKSAFVITHLPDRRSGLVREALELAGCPTRELNLFDDSSLPPIDEAAAIVSLGGKMSVTELDRYPFLSTEVALLRAAVRREIPTLGICLGAQLLAVASGGHVAPLPRIYLDWPQLSRTSGADDDHLFSGLPRSIRVLKWHEDGIRPPPAATILATTASPGAALFRVGPVAWGSQMHIELTPAMLLDGWLASPRGAAEIESAGHDIAEFRLESSRRLPVQVAAARPALDRFAQLVLRNAGG
jgi:GMP synthase-like glutamine amidotransferase